MTGAQRGSCAGSCAVTRLACSGRPVSRRVRYLRCFAAAAADLPGGSRAVVVLPGLGNNAGDYGKLSTQLQESYGVHVEVANVSRLDWARNAAGLLDRNYWTGKLQPRPTVDWYLEHVATAVEAAKAAAPGAPITLLAHSAGGWLGRLYLLDFDRAGIDRFVSLGSPHLPPPPGVVDQTRGILTFISKACPGAFHEEISYVTVAGRFIRGARLLGPGGWQQKVVGAGYQQVCGVADVWGDGVVPVPAAHLEGALQITLDGVYHSPLGSEEGSDSADVAQGSGIVSEEAAVVAAASAASDPEAADMVIDARLYDSDDYAATEKDMEEAAVEARPGPRLWYGSEGVLGRWAPLLWSSEPATMPEAVLKGWDI